ncbi:hypothetical protein BA917_07475 [Helicobacter pullorum]|uniref:hypothetical protein n=1 Tax=Helicobacter pullorum TaxID=35818 RepID=UPI0008168525|nr:hypothetical protein [Helicobacter pullorum]OCR19344.1 hypothetical protein BA917_07475 [Helicobacter pullorum]
MKKLRSFKIKKAKAMKKPVCLLKVLAGGDVELRFNKRHKRGKLNFEFKPWEAPIGSSEIATKILNYVFDEYLRNEENNIIKWDRVVDGFFEVGETIALYESFWKRIAPLSKINYSLENEKLYRQRTNREYRQLF